MSQGVALSPKTKDLNLIFFKIRESRSTSARRSWMRRARLALAERTDLTPAERHEIICTWIQPNSHQIDSPAMSKMRGIKHEPQPYQTIKAERFTRRNFDVKKPAYSGHCANDEFFTSSDSCTVSRTDQSAIFAPQHQSNHTLHRAIALTFFPQSQGYIFPPIRRDNDDLSLFDSDSLLRQLHHRAQILDPKKPQIKLSKCIFSYHPQLSTEQRLTL